MFEAIKRVLFPILTVIENYASHFSIRQKLIGYSVLGLGAVLVVSLINIFMNEGTTGVLRKHIRASDLSATVRTMNGYAKEYIKYYDTTHIKSFNENYLTARRQLTFSEKERTALDQYKFSFDSIVNNHMSLAKSENRINQNSSFTEKGITTILGGIEIREADLQMEGGKLTPQEVDLLRVARDGRILFLEMMHLIHTALLTGNDTIATAFEELYSRKKFTASAVLEYSRILGNNDYIQAAQSYQRNLDTMQSDAKLLFGLLRHERELIAQFDSSQVQLDLLLRKIMRTAEGKASTARIASLLFSLTLLIIVVVIFLLLSLVMIRAIDSPVKKLTRAIIRMGTGNFSQKIVIEGNDELTEISRQLDSMSENLRTVFSTVKDNARELENASDDLATASDVLNKNGGSVRNDVNSITTTLKEVANNVSVVTDEAQQMSTSVHTVASSIEEMSVSLNEITQKCQTESRITAQANERAQTTRTGMAQLEAAANTIGKVVTTISSIADRTKLLALNATIEAAGAGEAGRGFAVVANEVKMLARQTNQATDEIAKQIEYMHTETKSAIHAISEITCVIEEINIISQTIVTAVEEQNFTINELAKSVSQTSNTATAIATRMRSSSEGLSLVSQNMDAVANSTQTAAEQIGNIKRNSLQLKDMAATLNTTMNRFVIHQEKS